MSSTLAQSAKPWLSPSSSCFCWTVDIPPLATAGEHSAAVGWSPQAALLPSPFGKLAGSSEGWWGMAAHMGGVLVGTCLGFSNVCPGLAQAFSL